MNRRAFLTSAGITGALAIPSLYVPAVHAQSSSSTSQPYTSSSAVSALTSGNMLVGTTNGTDWSAVANSLTGVVNDWSTNNVDSQIGYSNFSPSQIKSANLNQGQILGGIQAYNPSVTMDQLQAMWRTLDASDPDQVQNVLTNLTQQGMGPYFSLAVDLANKFATTYSGSAAGQVGRSNRSVATPSSRPPALPPDDGGGYTCAEDGMVTATVGLAFLTIGVMSGIGLFAGAAWGAIAAWGGGATTVYGIGHNMKCGF